MRIAVFAAFFVLAQSQYHGYEDSADDFLSGSISPRKIANGRQNGGVVIRRHRQDEDSILFPDSTRDRRLQNRAPTELSRMIEFAKEISAAESIEEYMAKIDGIPPMETIVNNRFNEERSNVVIGKMAKCKPELQTVCVKNDTADSSTLYLPSCVRMSRCGGCCSHPLLSCQAVTKEIKNYQILVVKYEMGSEKPSYTGKELIPLEEHTKCKCDCTAKPEHCTERQEYNEAECRCACVNVDEEEKCKSSGSQKLWEPNLCTCLCRTVEQCPSGYNFSPTTCSCTAVRKDRRSFSKDRETNSVRKPEGSKYDPVVIGVQADDPRRKPKDDPEYK